MCGVGLNGLFSVVVVLMTEVVVMDRSDRRGLPSGEPIESV